MKVFLYNFRSKNVLRYVSIVIFLIYGCSTPPQNSLDTDGLTQKLINERNIPGISITILKEGKMVYSKGFGYADIDKKTLVDPSKTKFRIGSVSKTFAASALAKLYENGRLDLDKSIYEYVPEFPQKKWDFSTRQMAGHLSGIRHYKINEMSIDKNYTSVYDALEVFSSDELLHEPGTKYHYSTHAWTLISLVIERTSDDQFLSYMNKNIFNFLGMTNTQADLKNETISDRVTFYQYTTLQNVNKAPSVNNSWKWAGGGFLSTTEDVAKFIYAHSKPGFLNNDTIKLLMTSQLTKDGEETNYGLGWRIRPGRDGDVLVGHTGGSVGGTTYAFWNKNTDIILVIAANIGSAKFGDLPLDIFDLYR